MQRRHRRWECLHGMVPLGGKAPRLSSDKCSASRHQTRRRLSAEQTDGAALTHRCLCECYSGKSQRGRRCMSRTPRTSAREGSSRATTTRPIRQRCATCPFPAPPPVLSSLLCISLYPIELAAWCVRWCVCVCVRVCGCGGSHRSTGLQAASPGQGGGKQESSASRTDGSGSRKR